LKLTAEDAGYAETCTCTVWGQSRNHPDAQTLEGKNIYYALLHFELFVIELEKGGSE
jgi:hypothetical protein